jgi:hypothetical protein
MTSALRIERRGPQRHVGAIPQGYGHLSGCAVDPANLSNGHPNQRLEAESSRRNAGASAGPRLFAALVDRYVAIVDPLLVHPLPAESLLSSQRSLLDCRVRRGLIKRRHILSGRGKRQARPREMECEG